MSIEVWFDRVVEVFEEALRSEPQLFWNYATKEVARHPDCWEYSALGIPLPPLMLLNKGKTASEVSFFLTHDRWPTGLTQSCGYDLCVNPAHLDEISAAVQRIRNAHFSRKLNAGEISQIRALRDENKKKWTYDKLAHRFETHRSNVEDAYWSMGIYREENSG